MARTRPPVHPGRKQPRTNQTCGNNARCCVGNALFAYGLIPRDALEGKGPQRRPQRRLGRRSEEVAKALGGRLLSVTNAIEAGTWRQGDSGWAQAGRPGGGGGGTSPPSNASLLIPHMRHWSRRWITWGWVQYHNPPGGPSVQQSKTKFIPRHQSMPHHSRCTPCVIPNQNVDPPNPWAPESRQQHPPDEAELQRLASDRVPNHRPERERLNAAVAHRSQKAAQQTKFVAPSQATTSPVET